MSDRWNLPTPPGRPGFDDEFDDGDLDYGFDEAQGAGGGGRIRGWRRRDDEGHEDPGLFRMLAILVLVAVAVVALVFPGSPLRLAGWGGGGSAGEGITARERDDLPTLPPGLTAVSRLYELTVPGGLAGTQAIEVTLLEHTDDGKNLAFYTHEGDTWKRLGVATLSADGKSATGELPYPPKSVAVLRSVVSARSLGLIVDGGYAPDPGLLRGASVVAVRGASLGKDAKGLVVRGGALESAQKAAGGKPVYLAVDAGGDGGGAPLNAELAASIATAAKTMKASGVLVDLGALPREQREPVSRFAAELSARLRAERLGFLMGVPASGRDGGAYDWPGLLAVADGIWLLPRAEPARYYGEVDAALTGAREAGVDLARVALVLDRRSQETWGGRRSTATRRDALAWASTIARQPDTGVGGTPTVGFSAPFLSGSGGGLRWDDGARSVTFTFTEGGTAHAVWVENRFSAAFRLDLAARHDLGGIVVDQAVTDDGLADVAEVVDAFVQGTQPRLERPFGPYLVPCWQATGGGAIEGSSGCWQQDLAAPTAVWRAPKDAGAYTVRLVVSDGVVFVGQEVSVRVTPGGRAEPVGGAGTATPAAGASPAGGPSATPSATVRPGGTN
jgi:hypothetical protein